MNQIEQPNGPNWWFIGLIAVMGPVIILWMLLTESVAAVTNVVFAAVVIYMGAKLTQHIRSDPL